MPSTNLRNVVTRTLSVPVLLLLAIAISLSVWILHLLRAETWVRHTHEVLSEIHESERLLIDQETGLRGYMLSADGRFLDPYNSGRAQFPVALDRLRRDTADNPAQSRRVVDVRDRYRLWSGEAEAEKRLVKPDVTALLRDPDLQGRLRSRKEQMDAMRAAFASMSDEERHLLVGRTKAADRANANLMIAGTALVIICGVLLVIFLRRQLAWIDRIYMEKVEESERARHAAEAMAAEVREQSAEVEAALLAANRERDDAVRRLKEGGLF